MDRQGFSVIDGPFHSSELPVMIAAFEQIAASASGDDIGSGSTSVRINGLIERSRCFDEIYTHSPLLEAASALIGGPFKLSSFHIRNVRPGAAAQGFHQDVKTGGDGWPLLGFIFMVDEFTALNGATRFLPGSQSRAVLEAESDQGCRRACGAPGNVILFDGSIWHGHDANRTNHWRRSIQGAFIPRSATAAVDYAARMGLEARSSLSSLTRDVLAI